MTAGRIALIALAANAVSLAVTELVSLWLAGQSLLDVDSATYDVTACALGLLASVAVAVGALTGAARSTGARIAAAALALGAVGGLGWVLLWGGLGAREALALAPGLAVGLLLAHRPPERVALGRGPAALAIAASLAGPLGLGQAAVREAAAEYREGPLPAFTIELVAAYPYDLSSALPAIVVDRRDRVGDVITLEGQPLNLHRDDLLRIESADVRRVRWISDGESAIVTVRLDADRRAAFRARTYSRSSQYDAVLIDGEPRLLLSYPSPSGDRLVLLSPDRSALWRVYQRLTTE